MTPAPICPECHEPYQQLVIAKQCRVCEEEFCSYVCKEAHERRTNHGARA